MRPLGQGAPWPEEGPGGLSHGGSGPTSPLVQCSGPLRWVHIRTPGSFFSTLLEAFRRGEVDGWVGKDLDLQIGPRRLAFTSETFILSFSLPNFHFHAVTAYDILRSHGVPIGKRDYEGQLRTRTA
ncbi:DUF1993 family protein [Nannocystis punicea]|uniref:DUF1993 family protein n=1 Tax=Nannocystis punicea TaxID=2995304 RepID=A0ABY7GX37_9BACT|nr:DUF1993 family protein [Nannocystis poenicansa]WAS91487.1 DUF1993 family protein [Nannocystis poenicansa]